MNLETLSQATQPGRAEPVLALVVLDPKASQCCFHNGLLTVNTGHGWSRGQT